MSIDVLVIGCGPAGIAAGIEFEKSKINYLILEGRNRIGGRAFTDEITFGRECPVDLGAHYLSHHQEDNFLFQNYIKSDKDVIQTDEYHPSTVKLVDRNGHSISEDLINQSTKFVDYLFEMISNYSKIESNKDRSIFDLIHSEIDNISDRQIQELVRLFLSYTERHEGSDLNQLSTLFNGKAEANLEYTHLAIANGYGNLIKQIADKYQLRIELNSIVSSIDVDNEFVNVKTTDNRSYQSQFVLLTVPLGCLKRKSIEFHPPLPQWKENAIETMGFGLLDKIYLQFSTIFWEEHLQRITIVNDRWHSFYCFPEYSMLALYISGSFANEIEQLSDEEIIDDVMKSLKRIYSNSSYPIKWLVTRWSRDPFANGSYSTYHVGNDTQTVRDLARETHDGKVRWAGEHTNFNGCIGYVVSGVESGFREAKVICQRLFLFENKHK